MTTSNSINVKARVPFTLHRPPPARLCFINTSGLPQLDFLLLNGGIPTNTPPAQMNSRDLFTLQSSFKTQASADPSPAAIL
jgi:hypothetical protein